MMVDEYEEIPEVAPEPAKKTRTRKPKTETVPGAERKQREPASYKADIRAGLEVVNALVLSSPYAPLALQGRMQDMSANVPQDELDDAATVLDTLFTRVPLLKRLMRRGKKVTPWLPAILGLYRLGSRRLETFTLMRQWRVYVMQAQAEGFAALDFVSWLRMLQDAAQQQQAPAPGTQYAERENGYHPEPVMSGAME